MINKKLGTLAAAIFAASSAQAAFEVAFVAVDQTNGDTYVHDLGTYAAMAANQAANGPALTFNVSAVNSELSNSFDWTVVGTTSTSNVIAAPPGGGSGFTAYDDTGLITLSSGGPTVDGVANNQSINNEMTDLQTWFTNIGTGSGSSVTIAGSDPLAYQTGQELAFHSGRMISGNGGSYQLNTIFHSANASPTGAIDVNGTGATLGFSFDGNTAAVPVPAAAWLFGSALAGLMVARRRQ